jgi:sugar-specific transcriptional regulator TrmB
MEQPTTALVDYRANVEALFAKDSPLIIENKDRDHAAILISTLFNKAQQNVYVLSQRLEPEFYARKEIQDAMLAALGRGVTVKIVTQEQPETGDLISKLKAKAPDRVFFKVADASDPEAHVDFNFAVVDEKSFRFETNRDACEAFASANNPTVAKRILDSCQHVFSFE